MSKDRAYELFAKQLSGQASAIEANELKALIAASPELESTYTQVAATWELTGQLPNWEPDVAAGLAKLQTKIQLEERKPAKQLSLYKNLMKIAAVGIILLGAGFLIKNAMTGGGAPHEFVADQGKVEAIQMTDGSSILLDQTSKLKFFPAEKSIRKVSLNGQAFFDVQRNEDKPFIVTTANADIEVLGTSFNISAGESITEVVVKTGVVKVTDNRTNVSITLAAGESTVVAKDTPLTKQANQEVPFNSYEDFLRFEDQPVDLVLQRLGWSFGKNFSWNQKALKKCTLNSNLENKSLDAVLMILQEALNLEQFQVKGNEIILTGGHCK